MTRIIAKRPPVLPEQVREAAAQRMEELLQPYSRAERETWHLQITEAQAVKGRPKATAPLLSNLAKPRGLTVTEMADRVLSKREQYLTVAAAVLAAQKELLDMDPIPQDFAERLKQIGV